MGYLAPILNAADNFSNASAGVTETFGSSMDLVGPILIIAWAVTIVALISGLRSSRYFERFVAAFGALALSAYYAIYGLGMAVATAIAVAPVYLFVTLDGGTQRAVGRWAVIGIVAYGLLVGVGYVGRHYVVAPIAANARDAGLVADGGEEEA